MNAAPERDRHRPAADLRGVVHLPVRIADLCAMSAALVFVWLPGTVARMVHVPAAVTLGRVSVTHLAVLAGCWAAWSLVLGVAGVYRHGHLAGWRDLGLRLYTGVGGCALVALPLLADSSGVLRSLALFFLLSLLLAAAIRAAAVVFSCTVQRSLRQNRRVLIVGSGAEARPLMAELGCDRRHRFRVLGLVLPDVMDLADEDEIQVLGTLDDLEDLLMCEQVDEVLFAVPVDRCFPLVQQAVWLCEAAGVQATYSGRLFATEIVKRQDAESGRAGRVVLRMVHDDVRLGVKRAVDVLGALSGLVLFLPVFLLVMALVRLDGPGPILFRQRRFGLNRRQFSMIKFRTMVPDAEQRQAAVEHLNETGGPAFKIRHDPRVTRVGRLLRKTSLDELPQLWNVLRGDMSLVGPRPLPLRDVRNFSELSLMRRFSVKPGMTGLWQVSGRSDTAFAGWIALDLHYIDHWSLMLDAHILARTVPAVLRGSGAS